jgi:hypothetical protein
LKRVGSGYSGRNTDTQNGKAERRDATSFVFASQSDVDDDTFEGGMAELRAKNGKREREREKEREVP